MHEFTYNGMVTSDETEVATNLNDYFVQKEQSIADNLDQPLWNYDYLILFSNKSFFFYKITSVGIRSAIRTLKISKGAIESPAIAS